MGRLDIAAAVAVLVVVTGCSRDTAPETPPPLAPSPTTVEDRPRVEVIEPGASPRRVLRLALEQGAVTSSTLVVDQEVAADQQVTDAPPVTLAFDALVGAVTDDGATTSLTYGDVQVADPTLQRSLGSVVGASDEIVVAPDGTTATTSSGGDPLLAQVRSQVLSLLPVLPAEAVGVGATWTVGSVVDVDGAVVDQTATYTLESLDGDAYVIGVSTVQGYRTGEVEQVEVTSGQGTVSARLVGSLTSLLPIGADADLSTLVSYDVGGRVTEVRTTVALELTAR